MPKTPRHKGFKRRGHPLPTAAASVREQYNALWSPSIDLSQFGVNNRLALMALWLGKTR